MLNKAERILLPVVAAFLVTGEGRVLLMAEAAAEHRTVFAISIACFCILGLVCRLGFPAFVTPEHADHCSAFFKAVMLMSLVGIFMHEELPWITYTPLLFILLLLVLAIIRICKLNIDGMFYGKFFSFAFDLLIM